MARPEPPYHLGVLHADNNRKDAIYNEDATGVLMIPISLFIAMLCILMVMVLYTLHATEYVQQIFIGMVATMWAFVLAAQSVSGNVQHITSAGSSAVQVAPLSYILLFIAVIMALITVVRVITFIQVALAEAQR